PAKDGPVLVLDWCLRRRGAHETEDRLLRRCPEEQEHAAEGEGQTGEAELEAGGGTGVRQTAAARAGLLLAGRSGGSRRRSGGRCGSRRLGRGQSLGDVADVAVGVLVADRQRAAATCAALTAARAAGQAAAGIDRAEAADVEAE